MTETLFFLIKLSGQNSFGTDQLRTVKHHNKLYMKKLGIALLGVSIAAGTSTAIVPGVPETGREMRSVSGIDSQTKTRQGYHIWRLDYMTEVDGPLFAFEIPRKPGG